MSYIIKNFCTCYNKMYLLSWRMKAGELAPVRLAPGLNYKLKERIGTQYAEINFNKIKNDSILLQTYIKCIRK